MKTTHQILGTFWIAICGYFCVSLFWGTFRMIVTDSYRLDRLRVNLFFVLLYLAGAVASFYVLRGSRWGRIMIGIVALLTVIASLAGIFAFFNSHPYSVVGIIFDLFAVASAGVLLLHRRTVSA